MLLWHSSLCESRVGSYVTVHLLTGTKARFGEESYDLFVTIYSINL